MQISASGIAGALVGLDLFLGLAVVAIIAGNGPDNPGGMRVKLELESAARGATAPEPAPLTDGSLEGLDLDGDGSISLAEAAGHAHILLRFDRADRDRDGSLTQAEFERLAKLPPPRAAPKGKLREQIRRDAATAAGGG